MEARIYDNQIVVPIGSAISFQMIGKNQQRIDLKLTESEDKSKFFVLFHENDVDFEIKVNNTKCIHGIGYTLIVNNGFYDYYIGAGEQWSMEALYTKGRKLHFISQNSEEGQTVIQQTANEYDISYSESAAVCSRIEFTFDVEKAAEPEPKPRLQARTKGGSFLPSFGCLSANRVSSLGGQDVPDSVLCCSSPTAGSVRSNSSPIESSSLSAQWSDQQRNMQILSLASPWPDTDLDIRSKPSKAKQVEPQIGDKGVVCFGEQSNQFYNTYNGFTKDKDLDIKPFVVELRFAKKAE